MHNPLHVVMQEQLQAVPASQRLIFINPRFDASYIARNTFIDAAYTHFSGHNLDLEQAQQQLNLNGDALLLDEFDTVATEAQADLLTALLDTTQRIVIISRSVPQCLIQVPTLKAMTAFLPVSEPHLFYDYGAYDTLLEVYAMGKGHVIINGRFIQNWIGTLPHILFMFIVDRRMITRQNVFDSLWPDIDKREATNIFHVTKRKINSIIGEDIILYSDGFYRLRDDVTLAYDVATLTHAIQSSVFDQNIAALHQAEYLYGEDFLSDFTQTWAEQRRLELREDFSSALLEASQYDAANAESYLFKGLRIAPEKSRFAHALLKHYDASKDAQRIQEALGYLSYET
jgi:hypothetical protein